jgi:cyclase
MQPDCPRRRPPDNRPGPVRRLGRPERIAGNLHRAYAEIGGAPPGTAIDILAVLADMVAYNGGVPLTCLA